MGSHIGSMILVGSVFGSGHRGFGVSGSGKAILLHPMGNLKPDMEILSGCSCRRPSGMVFGSLKKTLEFTSSLPMENLNGCWWFIRENLAATSMSLWGLSIVLVHLIGSVSDGLAPPSQILTPICHPFT